MVFVVRMPTYQPLLSAPVPPHFRPHNLPSQTSPLLGFVFVFLSRVLHRKFSSVFSQRHLAVAVSFPLWLRCLKFADGTHMHRHRTPSNSCFLRRPSVPRLHPTKDDLVSRRLSTRSLPYQQRASCDCFSTRYALTHGGQHTLFRDYIVLRWLFPRTRRALSLSPDRFSRYYHDDEHPLSRRNLD